MTARSQALAAESETQLDVDPERSILLASAAVHTEPTTDAMFALRAAIDASPIRYRLPNAGLQMCAGAGVPTVAFSPNGNQIAEGLCNGTVALADAHTGGLIRRVDLGAPAGQVSYSSTSSTLAAWGAGRIALIDPRTGAIRTRGPRVGGFPALVFNPVSPVLAYASASGVTLWNVRTGHVRLLRLPAGLAPNVAAITFSPNGQRLALALQTPSGPFSDQPGLLLVNVATGRILASATTQADAIAFSPSGAQLAVAEYNQPFAVGDVVVRNARTLAVRRSLVRIPTVEMSAVAFSPDGSSVAFGAADGTAGLLSASTGQSIVSYPGQTAAVTQVAFSPDGRLVASASADGSLRVWRASGLELHHTQLYGDVEGVAPTANGFVSLSLLPRGGYVVQRRLASGVLIGSPMTVPATGNVEGVFTSSDGRLVGVIPNPSVKAAPIGIWNLASRREVAEVPLPPRGVSLAGFSPSGKTLVFGGPPGGTGTSFDVGLISLTTGHRRILGTTHCGGGWSSLAFAPRGNLVAAGSFCGQVYIWNVNTGTLVGHPLLIGGQLAALAFNPRGRQIAVGSWNSTVTVANVATGRAAGVLTAHTRGVPSVAYSPDGRYLASASLDGTMRIWNAGTLVEMRVISDLNAVNGVVFTQNSQDVLSWDSAEMLREWDACSDCGNPDALLALARTRVTRQLTPQERQTFRVG